MHQVEIPDDLYFIVSAHSDFRGFWLAKDLRPNITVTQMNLDSESENIFIGGTRLLLINEFNIGRIEAIYSVTHLRRDEELEAKFFDDYEATRIKTNFVLKDDHVGIFDPETGRMVWLIELDRDPFHWQF